MLMMTWYYSDRIVVDIVLRSASSYNVPRTVAEILQYSSRSITKFRARVKSYSLSLQTTLLGGLLFRVSCRVVSNAPCHVTHEALRQIVHMCALVHMRKCRALHVNANASARF